MIRDNIIYFGYGTIAVYSGSCGFKFTEIKPPQEIGEDILNTDGIEFLKEIKFNFDFDKFSELLKNLRSLNKDSNEKQICFQGYILDFNCFNKKSIDVIIKGINNTMMWEIMPLAC